MTDFRHAFRMVPVAGLKAWERNPRAHSADQVEQIRASIARFGFTNPLLVDESGRVIAGHGRLAAARLLGLEQVPAIELVGLNDSEKRALVIADNQLALNATWDESLLSLELGALKSDGFDLSLTGLTLKETNKLLGNIGRRTDPDDVPEPPKNPVAKVGDLWLLGRHRLLVGDSFDAEDVERLIGRRKVHMVLTDPPYAIYGSSTGIGSDIADDKMVRPFFEKLGSVIAARVMEFGHVYVHCDWRSYATLWHGLKSAQLAPKNCIVWDKGSAGLGNSYANTHEFVAFFAKLPKQKAMTSGNKRGQRPVHQANMFRTNRVTGDERKHNAAKPVDLLAWLIENSSDQEANLLDLFGGSGSTLIAAHRQERTCLMMEMEPRFADVIVERYAAHTGEAPVLEDGHHTWEAVKGERHGAHRAA